MVRGIHRVVLPSNGGTLKTSTLRSISGRGMGSILLDGGLGGPGAGSSYSSIDDYIHTTSVNPYAGQPVKGKGLEQINRKLESLMIKPKTKKIKNINFNL